MNNSSKPTVTIARGDGIGPEIMDATLAILDAAGADFKKEFVEIGEASYLSGNSSGISAEAWKAIRDNKLFLKAPITTPQGGGYKSLNVTLRKTLGLFANIRPCISYAPFVRTKHPEMDVVIVRENEEDLYAGIEHQQTDEVVQCLKLITRPGTERIVRYAFEFAKMHGRKKVTCFTKDNIMKHTDGLFHKIFKEIGEEYPEIEKENMIIDIGAARLADTPEIFDVVVMPNLYGDVVSDIAAQISGSVGLAGSSNIGESFAMFEAIHGSAPTIAGKNIANPSGLLKAAEMLLEHIGQGEVAQKIKNAWAVTIEDGIHTEDIFVAGKSRELVGTKEFAEAVIARLGQKPERLPEAKPVEQIKIEIPKYSRVQRKKEYKGVDLFVHWSGSNPDELAEKLHALEGEHKLSMITNRGVKVWPNGFEETFCTDHWRCRFERVGKETESRQDIAVMMARAITQDIDIIKTENLFDFDGVRGYSLGQGQ